MFSDVSIKFVWSELKNLTNQSQLLSYWYLQKKFYDGKFVQKLRLGWTN